MHDDIGQELISERQIAQRISELSRQITSDHQRLAADRELTIVPILTGAMIFCADLVRQMPLAMRIGLCTVSSYPGRSLSSQGAHLLTQQIGEVGGRHVLLIDDVLDSGSTLRLVLPLLRSLEPASIRSCVLLRKDRPSAKDLKVDYVGFEIPDVFVVGFGLDFNNYYRNLPNIVTLKRELKEGSIS